MKKNTLLKVGLCVGLLGTIQFVSTISSVQASQKVEKTVIKNETGTISISQLNKNVWVHTELGYFNGEAVPSNGLVLNTAKGLVLVDSSWDDKLTKELIEMVEKKFQKRVTDVIITHAHADRIGGITALKEKGVKAHSTALTAELAKNSGYEEPLGDLQIITSLKFGNTKVETFYPGKGHREDNIVVWLPQYQILAGGCLVKSAEAKDLGNVADAYVNEWSTSIENVLKRYGNINSVVPGHGKVGDKGLLLHTLDLLK
ncbi:BcII family subclass B1 metallo-beta-lactamase [Bacillus cereus]|uniref:BcII family subclass B1 metallo-beta-lactamase n=1 Tax=Bacillus cereus group TaxID=86661 RepID=UPI0007F96225|nr:MULTISPECIES: BcII family subclass B1 metallo-beta-lactamase [Bacillus cereus group]ARV93531.1 subclass B1 metallo-beta-lactamase [Bacillus thuringiensis]MDZ4486966.1 BcII family subclass B1 metallo-beta-lactamase [Bacillus cereus]MDZ4571116.1 BcII family subclass B1 metallo-beta-lactamase [Bacillus cereus]MDZ4638086.1 BcII family subclass B1 metallo-beta-lactamase [Bacillus cereus]MEB9658130.1 BcII family subclass B1 metallo-beta-lactamase [Bacillus cereus]